MTAGIHSGESLVSENNLVVPKQESTCQAEESSGKSTSELLGELPSELHLVDMIQRKGESIEELTSELPESKTEPPEKDSQIFPDNSPPSELCSESLDGLLLVESNAYSITSVNSESSDDLQSSSLDSEQSKDSLDALLHLTGAALARRLNVSPSTLRHKKNARNFGQWTSLHDPDGIAWYFDGQKFVALLCSEKVKPFK